MTLAKGQLEQSLTQQRELADKLTQLAFHDPLTGLANRSLFTDRVELAIARAAEVGRRCGVLFIDLDDFKTVNDTFGHAAGDQLLETVAKRVNGCIRPGDTAARLGGDEFAVLIDGMSADSEAAAIAARITEALRHPVALNGHDLHTQASIGIASSEGAASADELLRNADLAMYLAKSSGKGRYEAFVASLSSGESTGAASHELPGAARH